ncbi:MAG: rhodanese-related sulfurtransferase [Flavobacteriales bacterium]|nr:rhodanese-related sulfurtransferase [Flavobacteriales bacterium]
MPLHNRIDKRVLKEMIEKDPTQRRTVSFYRYVQIDNPDTYRDQLYRDWEAMGCMGRIYLAGEGINAQMNVPIDQWNIFIEHLSADEKLNNVPLKIAVEDDNKSFYKLKIKVRKKIVADGLDDKTFNPWDTGNHLSAVEFNEALENGAIVIDMRNHYESEVGHFKGAITPDADTFRQELKMVEGMLEGKEEKKILMYCTGGIRCEKASAYFKHLGFKDVNQLKGGIIEYAHQVEEQGLQNNYVGKNFVFDERLGERISDEVIAHCHQCGEPCDSHTNCDNLECHILFIQCDACKAKYENCCSTECQEVIHLPEEEQRERRKHKQPKKDARNVFKKGRFQDRMQELKSEVSASS